ncbi:hypothetical protein [Deinococcus peraridilitoris]|uniref:Lipoprotein n=1 Tax=Deinococcus peraridilitoris (strain DSM 19664 / LMG 22246 / CIP 109416 / KR-200) TaxID=937777 RepID=L0A5M2_DEIPD|nr:hypothetical protein [Deinococcus peraridilitoris]AFZ68320.1 hypothetical protein Deipe_2857 [Deinococcus peraridilitoris DSM 19664]
MNRLLLLSLGLVSLAACAPNQVNPNKVGKIVNVTSGEEGRLLLGGYGTVAGRNTARIEFAQNAYQGEYNVLASSDAPPRVGVSAGVSFSNVAPPGYFFSVGTRASNLRDGSLVVRNGSQVITCRFVVDHNNNGNGECTDGANARYTIQF